MSEKLITLMKERSNLDEHLRKLESEIKNLKIDIEKNKNEILKTCDHKWEWDGCTPGPYDKPDYICKICHSYDYRW